MGSFLNFLLRKILNFLLYKKVLLRTFPNIQMGEIYNLLSDFVVSEPILRKKTHAPNWCHVTVHNQWGTKIRMAITNSNRANMGFKLRCELAGTHNILDLCRAWAMA